MPHSKPALTSLASSLNRRSDPIFPSWMTTLSLSRRAWVSPALVIRPSVTMQPAIVPNFGDADPDFLEGRLEQAGHRLLHLVGHVVDHRMLADIDAFAGRDLLGV